MGKTSAAVKNRYNAKAYDRVNYVVPKGQLDTIKKAAESSGESVNGYITRAILARMGLQEWPALSDAGGSASTEGDP